MRHRRTVSERPFARAGARPADGGHARHDVGPRSGQCRLRRLRIRLRRPGEVHAPRQEPRGCRHRGRADQGGLRRDHGQPPRHHVVVAIPAGEADGFAAWLASEAPEIDLVGRGHRMELYKEVGLPESVAERFGLAAMRGTHAIGHTRMATESAVTTTELTPIRPAPTSASSTTGRSPTITIFVGFSVVRVSISRPRTTPRWPPPTSPGRCARASRSARR